jgi:hypothetical protein
MLLTEKDALFSALDAGRDQFLAAVQAIPAERENTQPADGGWSAREVAEHVVAAEKVMFRLLRSLQPPVDAEMSRDREAALIAAIHAPAAPARKFEAPELTRPTGRYATLAETSAAFLEARSKTRAWLEACELDLRRYPVAHPLAGTMSAYQFVLIIAMHPSRHSLQLRQCAQGGASQGAARG